MNKQEQIEKMMLDVPQTIAAYDANPKGQHLYGEQRLQIAEVLYDKGYGNVSEYKAEIERLEEQVEMQRNEKWDAQDDLECYHDEIQNIVKQAKIDVLNELKEKIQNAIDAYWNSNGGGYYLAEDAIDDIDEFIKEIGEINNDH